MLVVLPAKMERLIHALCCMFGTRADGETLILFCSMLRTTAGISYFGVLVQLINESSDKFALLPPPYHLQARMNLDFAVIVPSLTSNDRQQS